MDMKLVVEVARHGARAPSVLFDLAKDPATNFQEPMKLSELGASQHYKLGEYVRKTYFDDQVPAETMKAAKTKRVFAQSTDSTRTKKSATAQLQGLYGTDMTFPDLQLDVYPIQIGIDEDKLILTESENCPRYAELQTDVKASEEWDELFNEKMPEDLNPNLYDWLREVADKPDADLLEMSDVGTYVSIADFHDIELTFPVDANHLTWSHISADQFTYPWFHASEEFWQLSQKKMLELLLELTDVVFDDADPSKQEVLKENLYSSGSIFTSKSKEMPYFMLLLGHQETLMPLYLALGKTRMRKFPFASAFFFEFFEKDGEDFVGMVFRDPNSGEAEPVKLGCSAKGDDKAACPKAAFKSFVQERLDLGKAIGCDVLPYTKPSDGYLDIDVYQEGLYSDFTFEAASAGFVVAAGVAMAQLFTAIF